MTVAPVPQSTGFDAGMASRVSRAGDAVNHAISEKDLAGIREVAQTFESMFLSQMLSHMHTPEADPMFGGGPGEEMFQSMLTEEYGKAMAQRGGIGIAAAIERYLLEFQEV